MDLQGGEGSYSRASFRVRGHRSPAENPLTRLPTAGHGHRSQSPLSTVPVTMRRAGVAVQSVGHIDMGRHGLYCLIVPPTVLLVQVTVTWTFGHEKD
jgi:hypothetical protein